jgi:hypothetical protein
MSIEVAKAREQMLGVGQARARGHGARVGVPSAQP